VLPLRQLELRCGVRMPLHAMRPLPAAHPFHPLITNCFSVLYVNEVLVRGIVCLRFFSRSTCHLVVVGLLATTRFLKGNAQRN
jgi:hypothetical protein